MDRLIHTEKANNLRAIEQHTDTQVTRDSLAVINFIQEHRTAGASYADITQISSTYGKATRLPRPKAIEALRQSSLRTYSLELTMKQSANKHPNFARIFMAGAAHKPEELPPGTAVLTSQNISPEDLHDLSVLGL